MARELLTINQVAEYVGVSRRTVERWLESGKLPAFRLAGTGPRRIDRADLERAILKPE